MVLLVILALAGGVLTTTAIVRATACNMAFRVRRDYGYVGR